MAKRRDRLIETARQYQTSTYIRRFVAPEFQRMIRAEYGSQRGVSAAVVDGVIEYVHSEVGQVVCVTCGKVGPWSGGLSGMHTGHFLASRRNSIVFEETNVAPQCSHCNRYLGGAASRFRQWMEHVRGQVIIARLEHLKTQSVTFSREELVDKRIYYKARLKAAEESMLS